jgi:2-amino-4-hydroxy-6-hydroxymethyldihydropteridine diphosphokinase
MSDAASTSAAAALPRWAVVTPRRREHVARVTGLLVQWATELRLAPDEAAAWRDAGLLHDALRDLDEPELRRLAADETSDVNVLHGPAAPRGSPPRARRARRCSTPCATTRSAARPWGRVGRALYMADYLEPGRKFARGDRAFLAAHAAHDFDGVFRQVVRQRLEWTLREGKGLHASTVAMWNAVR